MLKQVYFGNSVSEYIISLIIFLILFIIIKIGIRRLIVHVKKIAEKTTTTLDDFLVNVFENIVLPALYFVAAYVAIKNLELSPFFIKAIDYVCLAVVIVSSARLFIMLIGYGFNSYLSKNGQDLTLKRSLNGIMIMAKAVIWTCAVILFLDNLGFKISAVIAGLGIGGVAVALAAQALLKDLFSYFAILFDRPFKIGDFIIIGDFMGTIEHIGIKTTRIRSLGGEMLIFSNSDLTDSRVRNYNPMEKRRVVFKIGVEYQTSLSLLKEIPLILKNIIEKIDDTVFDRAHFFSYGDFSLIFEIVYYVNGSDYNKYMDIQQKINFSLKEELDNRGIAFAYPTQTIYVNKS